MMPWWWIVGGLATLILGWWSLLLPMRMTLTLSLDHFVGHLSLRVRYAGLEMGDRWQIPSKTTSPPAPSTSNSDAHKRHYFVLSPQQIREAVWALGVLRRLNENLWERMVIEHFVCDVAVGLGDAAYTATLTGLLDQLLAWWMWARIAPRSLKPPLFQVEPLFDARELRLNFSSIIRLTPSDIIQATLVSFARSHIRRLITWMRHPIRQPTIRLKV